MLNLPVADAITRYLDLQTQQMRATAANMANVDTPGYRTVGLNFEQQFSQALDERTGTGSDTQVKFREIDGLVSRPDGNNVSMDREAMQMAQTQLQFRAGVAMLRNQFQTLSDAIKSDGR